MTSDQGQRPAPRAQRRQPENTIDQGRRRAPKARRRPPENTIDQGRHRAPKARRRPREHTINHGRRQAPRARRRQPENTIAFALASLLAAAGCTRDASPDYDGPPVPSPPSYPGAARVIAPRTSPCIDGSGAPSTQQRSVAAFDEVELRGVGEVRLHQGAPRPLAIQAATQVLERLTTEVAGRRLVIALQGCVNRAGPILIDAWSSQPSLVRITGSGNVRSAGSIRGERIDIEIAGSGDAELSLAVTSVRAHIAGSGTVTLRGHAVELDLSIAGSGDFRSEALRARRVKARLAGTGGARLEATDDLDATIIGSGDVRYRGNARLSQRILGSGTISKI